MKFIERLKALADGTMKSIQIEANVKKEKKRLEAQIAMQESELEDLKQGLEELYNQKELDLVDIVGQKEEIKDVELGIQFLKEIQKELFDEQSEQA